MQPNRKNRRRSIIIGIVLLLLLVGIIGALTEEDEPDRAARTTPTATTETTATETATPTATVTPTPTVDPIKELEERAQALADDGDYLAAVALLEEEDGEDNALARRLRRQGYRALFRQARNALNDGKFSRARTQAREARRLRKTNEAQVLIATATDRLEAQRAERREQRRLARIERDQRTCTNAEKREVRQGGSPPGCADYAAEYAQRQSEEDSSSGSGCDPDYSPCVPPYPPDLDCADTGPVTVTGSDPHGLDRDGDGVACGGD